DVKRYALPTPAIDGDAYRGEGFHLRAGGDAGLVLVAAKLTTYHVPWRERRHRLEDLHLLVADGFAVGPRRRFHCEIRQHLEEVILHDVADCSGLIVEGPAPLDAEVLRHGDLHTLDMLAVPDRLQERVGEAEERHVPHRPLAQVVVDAKDVRLVE